VGELAGNRAAELVIETLLEPGGVPVITVGGELDGSNVGSLEAAIDSVTAERAERLVFDLSGLRFMDSAGISALIGAAARVDAVELRRPSAAVTRVVELTGLSGVLPTEP
jgi:anti-anti-sigma factor